MITFMRNILSILTVFLFLSACANNSEWQKVDDALTVVKPAPVEVEKPFPVQGWDARYTARILERLEDFPALKTYSHPRLDKFCPGARAELKKFWPSLIQAMSFAESGYKPALEYQENFKGRDGKFIISTGLLQISISSVQDYGCKNDGMIVHNDLKDPLKNVSCVVRMIDYRLKKAAESHSFSYALGRYWSVMRPENSSYSKKTRKKLIELMPSCNVPGGVGI